MFCWYTNSYYEPNYQNREESDNTKLIMILENNTLEVIKAVTHVNNQAQPRNMPDGTLLKINK